MPKVKCLDCGMFAIYKGENTYGMISKKSRSYIRRRNQIHAATDEFFTPGLQDVEDVLWPSLACYRDVYDIQKRVEGPHDHYQYLTWGPAGMCAVTQLRRCSKFVKFILGRLPSDLFEENERNWHRRAIKLALLIGVATLVSSVLAAVAALTS